MLYICSVNHSILFAMSEDQIIDVVFSSIESFIQQNYPKKSSNVGWQWDEDGKMIESKIYGVGILTTYYHNFPEIQHELG